LAEGNAKDLIRKEPTLTSSDVMGRTTDNLPISSQKYVPSNAVMKRKINRFRRSQYVFKDPSSFAEIFIPIAFQNTTRGEKFLQYDSEDHRRILLFATQDNFKVSIIIKLNGV
jgi:hypothetical protein